MFGMTTSPVIRCRYGLPTSAVGKLNKKILRDLLSQEQVELSKAR
jgi:hypothetical protein